MNRRNFIIAGLGLLCLIVITTFFSLYNPVTIVSSNPKEGSTTFNTYEDVTLTFNQPLAPTMGENVSSSPTESGTTTISGSTLTFHVAGGFKADTLYTLTVKKPTDTKGQTGKTFTLHFTPQFVAFNQLPPNEQKTQIGSTDKVQSDYPFTSNLPHTEIDYNIKYKFDSNNQIVYLVTLNVVSLGAADPTYLPALKAAQVEADTWIRSLGYDPAVLKPVYNPDPNTGVFTPESN